MNTIAKIQWIGCQGQASDDQSLCNVEYSCGDRQLDSSVELVLDITQTEDQLKEAVRTAVSNDVNTKRGLSTTSADVRLL